VLCHKFYCFQNAKSLVSAQSAKNSLSEEWYYSAADITVTINIARADRTVSQARHGMFIVTTCHKTCRKLKDAIKQTLNIYIIDFLNIY